MDIEHFIFVKVDLSDLKDLKRAFDTVVDKYGTLDIMVRSTPIRCALCPFHLSHFLSQVNNAGLGFGDQAFNRALDSKEPEKDDQWGDGADPAPWALLHSVNTTAVIYGTQLAINVFRKANGGRGKKGVICSTASMAAFNTSDGELAIYGAGKAAIVYFTRKVQSLLKQRGGDKSPLIRINCVCPAGAATGMIAQGFTDEQWKPMFERIMKRFSVPVDRVADGMMMAIENESLMGEAIQVEPRGIQTWDFDKNVPKQLLAKI